MSTFLVIGIAGKVEWKVLVTRWCSKGLITFWLPAIVSKYNKAKRELFHNMYDLWFSRTELKGWSYTAQLTEMLDYGPIQSDLCRFLRSPGYVQVAKSICNWLLYDSNQGMRIRHVKATHATQIIYWIWNCVKSTMKILIPRWANMKIQALHYRCLSEMSNRYLVLYTTVQITEKSLKESI